MLLPYFLKVQVVSFAEVGYRPIWYKFVVTHHQTMIHNFEPFTPDVFRQQTGLNALDNEAVYIRWVNTQINYANYQQMQSMNASLKEIIALLKEVSFATEPK